MWALDRRPSPRDVRPRSVRLARDGRSAGRADAQRGFSLIELLIVICIIALASTGVVMGIGALTRSKMRAAAMQIVAATRFAYGRSVAQGTTVRLVFDMESGSMKVDEARGTVTLSRSEDGQRASDDEDEDAEKDESASSIDPWEAARLRIEQPLEPSFGRSPFGPVEDAMGRALSMSKARPLGERIRVVKIITPHDPEPLESGVGAVYFFPGGNSEHAVIQLQNPEEEVFSVEVLPLTGRARVHPFAYEPESLTEDDEVRDPG
jgi:general secretion pathway protein H